MNFRFPDMLFLKLKRSVIFSFPACPAWLLLFFVFFSAEDLFARSRLAPANDDCSRAMRLSDVTGWCGSPRQFTTDGATPSGIDNPGCFPSYVLDADNDVWFYFSAIATTVNISVIGNIQGNPKGTLQYPQLALYQGSCSGSLKEIACISDSRGDNIVETFVSSLAVGATYYIRVDARNNKTGTFQLCVNNFNPVPSPSSDCESAVVLCDKSSFTVPSVHGAGRNTYELTGGICLKEESSSAWYKWTCDKPGTLTFTLTPVNPSDDLDFALFWLPNGAEDCSLKVPVRCMASGENVNEPYLLWARCTGSTGLTSSSVDIVEEQGCDTNDDNFLSALTMESGKSYALVINNYHNTGNGFSIQFGGTGTFRGPAAHFTVSKLKIETGQDLYAKDASSFSGRLDKWEWNFGVDAKPQTAAGKGPHKVVYGSSGKKSISLSVETENGCKVTKVRSLQVLKPQPVLSEPVANLNAGNIQPPDIKEEDKGPLITLLEAKESTEDFEEEENENPISNNDGTSIPEMEDDQPELTGASDTVTTIVEYSVKYVASLYFKADSFSLEEKDFETLNEVLVILNEDAEYIAFVEGHTNNIPSDDYCLKLGAKRADAAIEFLTQKGIHPERLIRKVYGKKRAYSKDFSLQNRRRHQRVDIKIIKKDE